MIMLTPSRRSIVAVADMLMGFYLFAIAIQDLQYREVYHQYSHQWTSSLGCTFVGVVAMTSTEVRLVFQVGIQPIVNSWKKVKLSIELIRPALGFPVAFSLHVDGTILMHSIAIRLHQTQPEDG